MIKMEVSAKDVLIGSLMAIVAILLYINLSNQDNAKKLDDIHALLFNPDKTNVTNN